VLREPQVAEGATATTAAGTPPSAEAGALGVGGAEQHGHRVGVGKAELVDGHPGGASRPAAALGRVPVRDAVHHGAGLPVTAAAVEGEVVATAGKWDMAPLVSNAGICTGHAYGSVCCGRFFSLDVGTAADVEPTGG
jgi:hypothetical protein